MLTPKKSRSVVTGYATTACRLANTDPQLTTTKPSTPSNMTVEQYKSPQHETPCL